MCYWKMELFVASCNEGNIEWKADALNLLSLAISYGIGEVFKEVTVTLGKELFHAGVHGLASGACSDLDGENNNPLITML